MAIENNLKCAEFDENYYAMLIDNSMPPGKKLRDHKTNPVCWATGTKDTITAYTPRNKELKNYQFMDFVYFDYNVFVSEKIKTRLEGIIPLIDSGAEGPGFFKDPVYLKTEEEYLSYYGLFFPQWTCSETDRVSEQVQPIFLSRPHNTGAAAV